MAEDDELKGFGPFAKRLREARGLTQEELAERCGLAADTVRRLEHDSFSPSLRTLKKYVAGLDLQLSTLFAAFELGERDEVRELNDLVSSRTPAEVSLVTQVVRKLLDGLDAVLRSRKSGSEG